MLVSLSTMLVSLLSFDFAYESFFDINQLPHELDELLEEDEALFDELLLVVAEDVDVLVVLVALFVVAVFELLVAVVFDDLTIDATYVLIEFSAVFVVISALVISPPYVLTTDVILLEFVFHIVSMLSDNVYPTDSDVVVSVSLIVDAPLLIIVIIFDIRTSMLSRRAFKTVSYSEYISSNSSFWLEIYWSYSVSSKSSLASARDTFNSCIFDFVFSEVSPE